MTVEVTDIKGDGIEVKINDDLISFIKKPDLSREKQEQRPERFAIGNRIDAKIVSVDANKGMIKLSIKQLEVDEHKKAIEEYGSSSSGASLGDILGAAIEDSKK